MLTARTEVTGRMLIFSECHLRSVLAGCARHCNGRRPHRSGRARRAVGLSATTPTSTWNGSTVEHLINEVKAWRDIATRYGKTPKATSLASNRRGPLG